MRPAAAPRPPAADVQFLALGDSYTIGESVSAEERWPVQLVALLRARGIAFAEPTIVARTGWTTDELARGIDAARPAGVYDLVTLLIGVNDQYRDRPIAEYSNRFRSLLDRAVGFAGGHPSRVVVLSIPDWGVTPFAAGRDRLQIAREIDAHNTIARDVAARAGARFIDVTTISRRAAAERELVASDGLHPSGTMYAEWARVVLPAALAALGRS